LQLETSAKMIKAFTAFSLLIVLFSCQETKKENDKNRVSEKQLLMTISNQLEDSQIVKDTKTIAFELVDTEEWLLKYKTDSLKLQIVLAINRTDLSNISRMDSIVIPKNLSYNKADYLPFPIKVNYLKDIQKIIFFSYPAQIFAAYEKGVLIRTGPTNMGRENYLTPTGLFFTNWKAKVKVSTIDSDWILNWNFNVLNKAGIGWHEYSLPGYPASHSCLRLQEKDAYFLYNWADQWVLANAYTILIKGTPVIIFGDYDFTIKKPWRKLISNPKAFDITEEEMQKIITPYFNEILAAQKKRDSILNIQH
jgi:hypothetical protein